MKCPGQNNKFKTSRTDIWIKLWWMMCVLSFILMLHSMVYGSLLITNAKKNGLGTSPCYKCSIEWFSVLSLLLMLHWMVCGSLFVINASWNSLRSSLCYKCSMEWFGSFPSNKWSIECMFSVLSILLLLHRMVCCPLFVTNSPWNGLWSSPCN